MVYNSMKKNNCVKKGTHLGADPGFPKRGGAQCKEV